MKIYSSDGKPLLELYEIDHPSLANLVQNIQETKEQNTEFDQLSAYLLLNFSTVGNNLDEFRKIGKHWIELMVKYL